MRIFILLLLLYAAALAVTKPKIVILATGGTIAGVGQSSVAGQYQASKLPVENLLQAVPEIHNLAIIEGEQVCQVSSQDMTGEIWLQIARKVDEVVNQADVDGVVITHGTDTMEETAYFLNLVIQTRKPVVITGAMRAPGSLSADGSMNLYNAVALAASAEAQGKGVLLCFNDQIHAAREVTKANTTNVAAFQTPEFGILGYNFYGKPSFYRESTRKHTFRSEFDIKAIQKLPKVTIFYGHADFDSNVINQSVKNGTQGLVFAGTGNGNPSEATIRALASAVKNKVVVVRSSRTGSGPVTLKAEVDDEKYGFIVADNLNPQKSRILLMLALTRTTEIGKIQQMFFEY